VGRKKTSEGEVRLYYHAMGPEIGRVELVIPDPTDPVQKCMICRSESGDDYGVVFPIELENSEYEMMCKDNDLTTMMGTVIEADEDEIQILEVPEKPPLEPPNEVGRGGVRMLRTPSMWKHPWGRCCCVKHGDDSIIPVTTKTIRSGEVPWWGSPFTPYQLDLIQCIADLDENAMHVLPDDEHLCSKCGHYVWLVMDEDVPTKLPPEGDDQCFEEPLVPERNILSVPWESKSEAWNLFRYDAHNQHLIESSGLPISRASDSRRFQTEEAFGRVNSLEDRRGEPNIYTVRDAFYAALGPERSGTWADFDIDMLRLINGLEEVDVPASVLEGMDLGADVQRKVEDRKGRASSDSDAEVLNGMMDDDEEDDDEDEDDEDDEEEADAVTKKGLIKAAQALQRAIGDFIQALSDYEEES
jgi:hypothetical protein